MNALKKLLSVLLVACMALSVCAVSFAEGTEALPRVMAMKGPTAMGLSKLMTDEAASYDFSIASAIDEITPKLVKGENIFKTIYFMPMVTSSVAISIVFQQMFGNNYGVINWFVTLLGGEKINWLGGDGSLIKVAVIVMFAWKWIGWNMVIYLAGMQGISNDIYEAAEIDGANQVQVLFKICIPLLKPIIIFTIIQSTIGMFNLFTEPFILTGQNWQGGLNNGGLTLMTYLLSKAPQGGNLYGYASAVAYIITIMIVIISVCVNKGTEDKKDPDYIADKAVQRQRKEMRKESRKARKEGRN